MYTRPKTLLTREFDLIILKNAKALKWVRYLFASDVDRLPTSYQRHFESQDKFLIFSALVHQ